MSERLILEMTCDQCKRKERVDQITSNQTFLQWKTIHANGETLNFCSIKCERKFLEKTLNTKLR
jgi:hypothetical protein